MLTMSTTIPAGRYGLMPIIDITDELDSTDGASKFIAVVDPINELDGSVDDDSDEPELIFIDANSGAANASYQAVTNRGRTMNALLLDVASSCSHPEEADSWPADQNVSFDTPYGALTVADGYVLLPVVSDKTNPEPADHGAHNWLVFDLVEETQIIVDNGAIVIGDRELELLDLCRQPYVGAPA